MFKVRVLNDLPRESIVKDGKAKKDFTKSEQKGQINYMKQLGNGYSYFTHKENPLIRS